MLRIGRFVRRQSGNAMLFVLVLLVLLMGLTVAQVAVQQKNLRQSSFYLSHAGLHQYAESGLWTALHEINLDISESPGNIGTDTWDETMDAGRDGSPGTGDEGEGDGIPTPGEPGVYPVPVGPEGSGIGLIVHLFDTAVGGVRRIVATSFNAEGSVTLEKHIQLALPDIPEVGALVVSPQVALDLRGTNFVVDGNDRNLDDTPGPAAPVYGLTTEEGAAPGDNAAALLAQIPPENYDQFTGLNGPPSVGETTVTVDLNQMAEQFIALQGQSVSSGTYDDVAWGTPDNMVVTYGTGDVRLSGQGSGAGVLVVDGRLTFSGNFTFRGLVIVRGDVTLRGGGSSIQVYGSLMVTDSLAAIDTSDVNISGRADIVYSSEALRLITNTMSQEASHESVLFDEFGVN